MTVALNATAPALIASLIENERVHLALEAAGLYDTAAEERRNSVREELETKLFALPTSDISVLAAKLHALWPDMSMAFNYEEAPTNGDIPLLQMWELIHDAQKLAAEEEERRAGA